MKKQFVALTLRSLFALLLACTLVSAEEATENAPAAPQLQNLKHLVLSPTSEEVILQLNGSYSPKVFTLKDENPRIIFDFDGMTYGRSVKSVTTTNGSIVKRVRVGMHAGNLSKTRIVFDVSTFKGLNFTQKFDASNSTLVVQFTGPGKAAAPRHQEKAAVPAPAKEAASAPVTTPGSAPEAAAVPPEQAAAPQPPPAKDELEKAAAPPAQPEPSQPPAQPAPAPAKETAAAKQPQPEKAEVPAPAAKPAAKESTKKERTKPEEKKDALPEATAMKPEKVEAAGAEASPPPETAAALPVPAPQAAAAPATAKSEEPEKPAKETAAQPAPESKKEKKAKAAAQAQEAAAAPAAASAADKKAGAPDAGKPETADKPAILANATDKPQIEYVKFDDSSPKGEMVMFKLNGFHPPAIHGVEEGIPRVICDFSNTKLLQKSKGPIKTNGKFIKVIRTTTTKKPEKVRVVIDLEPNRSYDLQQVFFKEDNLFVLIVNTAKK